VGAVALKKTLIGTGVPQEPVEQPSATVTVTGELARVAGPRSVLREAVEENAGALANVVVGAALGNGSADRGRLALSAITQADPAPHVTIRGRIPRTDAEVNSMSLSELEAVAEELGIE